MSYEKKLEDKTTRLITIFIDHPIRMIFLATIFLGVLGLGVGVISSVFSTATTVATTPGKLIKRTLEPDNILQSYEWFYDVNAAYTARLKQVQQFTELLRNEQDPAERQRLRIDTTAMQQTCRDLATKYNANSEKMNKSIFKGWSLPATLTMEACG